MKTIEGKENVVEGTLKGVSKLITTNSRLDRERLKEIRWVQDSERVLLSVTCKS